MRQSWREASVGGTAVDTEREDCLLFTFDLFIVYFLPGAAAAGASSISQVCWVSPIPTTRAGRPLWSPCGRNT